MSGHNVSHSQRKTKRKFRPNVRNKRIYSQALKGWVLMKVSSHGMKMIECAGGLDAYLLKTKLATLTHDLKVLRKEVIKALESSDNPFSKALLKATVQKEYSKAAGDK